ncbi:MAG: DUF4230 domain-containing protein, partial [Anaerolineales bacterium]
PMNNARGWLLIIGILMVLVVGMVAVVNVVRDVTEQTLQPVNGLGTQVSEARNPTPTILADPVTIIHDVRALARLETVQYTVERVITAETGQGIFGALFGDKLLFVAHGVVIAGVDLDKLGPKDMWLEDGVLYVRLPEAEIFVATLDNEKSYVYDRETGLLTKGDVNLETGARQVAEDAIEESSLEDGILDVARKNAEAYFSLLLRDLGYPEVVFVNE